MIKPSQCKCPAPLIFSRGRGTRTTSDRDILLIATYQTEREASAISGSLRRPAMSTRIWKYQVSRQSMTAEARDSLKNSGKPENASVEKPVQVSRHRRLVTMYTNCAATMTHQLMLSMSDAPRRPRPSW
uniref:Uncharacterized protein n=1 Tax=Oryza brachyantha TaxID=4533 RepID=J3LQD9_ORYBR